MLRWRLVMLTHALKIGDKLRALQCVPSGRTTGATDAQESVNEVMFEHFAAIALEFPGVRSSAERVRRLGRGGTRESCSEMTPMRVMHCRECALFCRIKLMSYTARKTKERSFCFYARYSFYSLSI